MTNAVTNAEQMRDETRDSGSGRDVSLFVPKKRDEGRERLRQFNSAPSSVQDAFFRQLGEQVRKQRELVLSVLEMNAGKAALLPAPLPPETHVLLRWDEGWNRRARAIRRAALCPDEDWTPDREADPLPSIPSRVYVEALTGEEVPHNGSMRCPLPDHEDANPSFRVYAGTGWRCFGCGKSGTIYDLASLLWDVEPRGRGFVELHKRLRAVFA